MIEILISGEAVRFMVKSVTFASPEELQSDPDLHPMQISASVQGAGLGMLDWWPDEEDEGSKAEAEAGREEGVDGTTERRGGG